MKAFAEYRNGDGFMKDLRDGVAAAHSEMVGACAVSSDPRVTAAWARWKTYQDLTTHLEQARRKAEQG